MTKIDILHTIEFDGYQAVKAYLNSGSDVNVVPKDGESVLLKVLHGLSCRTRK